MSSSHLTGQIYISKIMEELLQASRNYVHFLFTNLIPCIKVMWMNLAAWDIFRQL